MRAVRSTSSQGGTIQGNEGLRRTPRDGLRLKSTINPVGSFDGAPSAAARMPIIVIIAVVIIVNTDKSTARAPHAPVATPLAALRSRRRNSY
eukprot:COSAG02_NODE_891_length_16139_cov_29.045885_2_plen_92_part_00